MLLLSGGAAAAGGVLPPGDVLALGLRVWPLLVFVVALTVVTELAAAAGVFTAVAARMVVWGRGRAWGLWLLTVVLAVVLTAFLSLDTTAVLLTPVVVVLARQAGLSPWPFALTTVWLANTASLWLPVSNLTNLLAVGRLAPAGPAEFVALMAPAAAAATLVPVAALFLLHRRALLIRYVPRPAAGIDDRVLLGVGSAVVLVLMPALVSGAPVWIPATAAALVLLAAFALRRPAALRWSLVPWPLVLFASGLFLAVEVAHALGLTEALVRTVGDGESAAAVLWLLAVSVAGANAVNNLPAYLALEPVAESPLRLATVLIGVNAGPLLTPWASLATLLWHDRLTSMGLRVSWWRFLALGCVLVPLTTASAALALLAAR